MAEKEIIDRLDALTKADPLNVIALMLWKERMRNPDLYVQIAEPDIIGFEDCVRYLKVTPHVEIIRPAGIPAQPEIPATHNRKHIPARPATDPKPYVIVRLVEKGTGNAIRPVENNQADFDKAQDAAAIRAARDNAYSLAQRLVQQASTGEYSLSDMTDAANALLTLAKAV